MNFEPVNYILMKMKSRDKTCAGHVGTIFGANFSRLVILCIRMYSNVLLSSKRVDEITTFKERHLLFQ